jgi:hypothetical protein
MELNDSVSEEEAVLLHIAGQLKGVDPRTLLKSVGIVGAEKILVESSSKELARLRLSIFNVVKEFHHAKSVELNEQVAELQTQISALKSKYEPSISERMGNLSLFLAVFGGGLILGAMAHASYILL